MKNGTFTVNQVVYQKAPLNVLLKDFNEVKDQRKDKYTRSGGSPGNIHLFSVNVVDKYEISIDQHS